MTRTKLRTTIAAVEREACAAIADELAKKKHARATELKASDRGSWVHCKIEAWFAEEIAAAIRARGEM